MKNEADKNDLADSIDKQVSLRTWRIEDVSDLTAAINNKNILDNLRDGIPYPYTEKDAEDFIIAMMKADKNAHRKRCRGFHNCNDEG